MFISNCLNCNEQKEVNKTSQICRSCLSIKICQEKLIKANKIFISSCENCNSDIYHNSQKDLRKAEENKSHCLICAKKIAKKIIESTKSFSKECPNCKTEILNYNSEKALVVSIKYNANCPSCCRKIVHQRPDRKEKLIKQLTGENNPMYGKSYFDIWVEKYGIEEAKKRDIKKSLGTSKGMSGEKNHMYGKPSPQGSGNGWKGHYKGIYFASLRELYYLKYLLDNNIKFENGELRKYKIPYEFMNKKLNYFPDFYLTETREYIEIKPKKLLKSPKNKAKFEAAKKLHGDKFKVITEDDIRVIDLESIYNMFLEKEIVFIKKYEEKFLEYYHKNKKGN